MNNYLRLFIFAFLALLMQPPLWAQQNPPPCSEMKYEHRNMIDYGPLRISVIRGSANDIQGFVVPNACVGVFSEMDHKLIATGEAGSDGVFEIRNVPNGRYRLIVACDSFCAANVSIILRNRSRGKKRLVAMMKPRGIDVCSFVEWK